MNTNLIQEDIDTVIWLQKRSKLLFIISMAVIILSMALIGIFLYWNTYPYDPLVFKDQNGYETNTLMVGNEDKEVPNGGYLELLANYCKNTDAVGKIEVYMVGETSKDQLIFGEDIRESGCYDKSIPVKLPKVLTSEKRHLEMTVKYQVNPIRTVSEVIQTEEFDIVL